MSRPAVGRPDRASTDGASPDGGMATRHPFSDVADTPHPFLNRSPHVLMQLSSIPALTRTRRPATLALLFPVAVALLTPTPSAGQSERSGNRVEDVGVDMLWAVKIPLRDGVRLNATVFK